MGISALHLWKHDPDEAVRLQETLRSQVVLTWDGRPVRTVGGVDVSYRGQQVRAAIAVLHFPDLSPHTSSTIESPLVFPYIPGLLAFRLGPAIMAAWEKLPDKPDILMIHGHGIAHPRGLGLASHLGLWLELPTIGVARRRLNGSHAQVGAHHGDRCELLDERDPTRVIGVVVRLCENSQPLYVSPGHQIDLAHALEIVQHCSRGHRMPEPLRLAHHLSTWQQARTGDASR